MTRRKLLRKPRLALVDELLVDLEQNLALAAQVLIDSALGGAGGRGDFVRGGAEETLVVKELSRGVENSSAEG